MTISLVAGLGNPGREYEQTRHNLGWVVLAALAAKHGLTWRRRRPSSPRWRDGTGPRAGPAGLSAR